MKQTTPAIILRAKIEINSERDIDELVNKMKSQRWILNVTKKYFKVIEVVEYTISFDEANSLYTFGLLASDFGNKQLINEVLKARNNKL